MNYTENFTKNLFKYCTNETIKKVDELIQNNNHNGVRIAIEKDMDDRFLYMKGKIKPEKRSVFEGRKLVYSLFMEEYIKHLDKIRYDSRNRRRQSFVFISS
jgi:hypothetical protein